MLDALFAGLHREYYRSMDLKLGSQPSHISFVEIDHEIVSIIYLPFLLIQEGLLSVNGKRMYKKYWLIVWRTKPAQENCMLTDWLGMTLTVLTGP